MNRSKRMYYFDSNVFIFPQIYDLNFEFAAKAKKHLVALAGGRIEGCTATLTWDEIVYILGKKVGLKESLIAGKQFFDFSNLRIFDVDLDTISMAQRSSRILV